MASGTSARTQTSAKNTIVKLLKADHKHAKEAFKAFEKMDPHEDPEGVQALVEQTCGELEIHAELEEQIFYPAARGAIKEEDLIDEAEVEHMTFKMLLEQLKSLEVEDEKYAATFKVLGEYVQHHVKEEEGEMFKQLENDADWSAVCDQMLKRREELFEEKGIAVEESAGTSSSSGSRKAAGGTRRAASPSSSREARPQAADESDDE